MGKLCEVRRDRGALSLPTATAAKSGVSGVHVMNIQGRVGIERMFSRRLVGPDERPNSLHDNDDM